MVETIRDRSSEEYKAAMVHLYDDRSDADLTIICGDQMVKVHSLALWPRSPYFHQMCKGGFKEANTGIIELKEEDPFLLGRMLSYCYMMGWTCMKHEDETTWISDLDTLVKMYTIADKYDIQGLKAEAKERFSEYTSQINSEMVYDFLSCLPEIYKDTLPHDRALRDAAVISGTKIWHALWKIPEFKGNLNGYDEFINDVVMKLRGSFQEMWKDKAERTEDHEAKRASTLDIYLLFDTRDEGDITFLCSDNIPAKAHSIVLRPRSEYFNTMCNGWSKEAKMKQIPAEESSIMILRMLRHFYMLNYGDEPSETQEQDMTSLLVNMQMYRIGDKYLLETLKTEALQKFTRCLEKDPNFDKFLEVVPVIYSNTPTSDQGLRLVAQKYGARNCDQLWTLKTFEDIILESPAWAMGIISIIRQAPNKDTATGKY